MDLIYILATSVVALGIGSLIIRTAGGEVK